MGETRYIEDFENGPGGWFGWRDNFLGARALERIDSAVVSYSPWWIDYNHAPPGAGYLHMLFGTVSRGPLTDALREYGGPNHFIEHSFPLDFTNAQVTVRMRGEIELRGAEVCLLVQGSCDGLCSGWVLTGRPFRIEKDWTIQAVRLEPDPDIWTCLGARHDRMDSYGWIPLADILRNVNTNFYFILFPLDVAPMGRIDGDPHRLRAGRDYRVWRSRLPEGYVMLDSIEIAFADDVEG